MQCKSERGFLFVPSATLTERISASLQCKRERETQLKVPSASASALREAFFLKVKRQRNAAKGAPLRGVRHSLQGRSVSGTKAAMHPFASLRRVLGNDSFSISGRVSLKEERQTLSQRKRRNPSRERGLCLSAFCKSFLIVPCALREGPWPFSSLCLVPSLKRPSAFPGPWKTGGKRERSIHSDSGRVLNNTDSVEKTRCLC